MATTWYFRNTNATGSNLPSGKKSTDTDSFTGVPSDKNTVKDMLPVAGAGQTSVSGAYSTATTVYTMHRLFSSPPLQAQTLTGGLAGFQVGVGTLESNVGMNKYQRIFVYICRSDSNVKTIITVVSCPTEHTTAETGCVITAAGAAGDYSIQAGDRLIVECWWDLRATKTTSYTATMYYDGTTALTEGSVASNAKSFFYSPQTLNILQPQSINATAGSTVTKTKRFIDGIILATAGSTVTKTKRFIDGIILATAGSAITLTKILRALRSISATAGSSAVLDAIKLGGTTFYQNLNATAASAASIARNIIRAVSLLAMAGSSVIITKICSFFLTLSATASSILTLIKRIQVSLLAISTSLASLLINFIFDVIMTATEVSSATLSAGKKYFRTLLAVTGSLIPDIIIDSFGAVFKRLAGSVYLKLK